MKVLHVLNQLRFSGAEFMLLAASEAWMSRGLQLGVIEIAGSSGSLAGRFRSKGWRHFQIESGRRPELIKPLVEIFQAEQPDIIHAHSEWSILPVAIAAHRAGIPVLRTVHHIFLFEGSRRVQVMAKRRLARSLGVFHVTNSLPNQINELDSLANASVLIQNWVSQVDGEVEHSKSDGQGRSVILSLGGCAEYKNHSLLIRALSRLPEDVRPLYRHVGPENEISKVERRTAQSLGLSNDVEFVGTVKDLSEVLSQATLMVQPSREEGFGVAIADALCAGVPVLLSDRPAHNGVFDHLPGVHWCEPTEEGIASALQLLLTPGVLVQPDSLRTRHSLDAELGAARYAYVYAYLLQRKEAQSPKSAMNGIQGLLRGEDG